MIARTDTGTVDWKVFRGTKTGQLCVRLHSLADTKRKKPRNKVRPLHYDPDRKLYWFATVTSGFCSRGHFSGETAERIRAAFPPVNTEEAA